jgi:hypothetical protein
VDPVGSSPVLTGCSFLFWQLDKQGLEGHLFWVDMMKSFDSDFLVRIFYNGAV